MRSPSRWLWAAAGAVFAFLYLPLAVVVAYSFNDSRLNAEWVGFTLRWYALLWHDQAMQAAARNTLGVALAATLASTVLGTLAGFALGRLRRSAWLSALVLAPVALPELLQGVSLLMFFVMINLTLGLLSIVLAHGAFCIGFVAVVVRARLADMDESLTDAARDLGATPWRAFVRVTLPLIAPGVAAGALLAFTLSIDDFVVSYFTAGVDTTTLPLLIYSMIRVAVTPEVNAVSTLLLLLTLALLLLARRLAPVLALPQSTTDRGS